jgi:hypothetical protein
MDLVRLWIAATCAGLLISAGATPQPPPPPSGEEGLKEMISDVQVHRVLQAAAAAQPEDFNDYVDSMPTAFYRVKDGEYVVAWGVGRSASLPGAGAGCSFMRRKCRPRAVRFSSATAQSNLTAAEFSAALRLSDDHQRLH